MEKRLFVIIAILSGLLTSCYNPRRQGSQLAELGFSEEYAFVCDSYYYDGKETQRVSALAKDYFSSIGFDMDEDEDIDLSWRTYGNGIFVATSFISRGINYCGALRITLPDKKYDLFEFFTIDTLVSRGLLEETVSKFTMGCHIVEGFGPTVSFSVNGFTITADSEGIYWRLQFDYSAVTLENTYAGDYKGPDEGNLAYIDETHAVKTGRTVFSPSRQSEELVVENTETGEEWDVISSLEENETYRRITQIYSVASYDYFYYIMDGDLYVAVDNYFLASLIPDWNNIPMPSCVFLADPASKTFSYLGYTGSEDTLTGILKIG